MNVLVALDHDDDPRFHVEAFDLYSHRMKVVYQPTRQHGPTVELIAEKLPGNPYVTVDAATGSRVITVMVPK